MPVDTALSVKLTSFEGPLDLLLHLIDKNKVSIYDIPVAQITDQYLEYVRRMEGMNLDVMSDFLVMAATLLEIKAKMLLPAEKNEEGEEIDPREELVRRLLEYKTAKYMSLILKDRESEAGKVFYRNEKVPEEVRRYRPPVDPDELLDAVTLGRLQAVFMDVMKRSRDRMDPVRSTFGRIEKEEVDAGAVLKDVEKQVIRKKRCTFRSLLEKKKSRMVIVVTFLSVLELMKTGRIEVSQDETFGEIMITALDPSMWREEEPEEAAE